MSLPTILRRRTIPRVLRAVLKRILADRPHDPYLLAEWYRKRGLEVGTGTAIYPDVTIGHGNKGFDPIRIGANCVLTGCTILGHDASTNRALGLSESIRRTTAICDRCFVGTGAIILMGVTLGSDCIVGAGAVVTKSFPPGCVVVGNPARVVNKTDALIARRRQEIESAL